MKPRISARRAFAGRPRYEYGTIVTVLRPVEPGMFGKWYQKDYLYPAGTTPLSALQQFLANWQQNMKN